MASTSCSHVSRNELTPGGTVAAISAIKLSGIGPGPLGIAVPISLADARWSFLIYASGTLAVQSVFTPGTHVRLTLLCLRPHTCSTQPVSQLWPRATHLSLPCSRE